jgi:UDP-glucuronate decarboxylase
MGVVSNFIVQALQNQDMRTRQSNKKFQYVDDLVEGMIRLMNSKDSLLDL